MKIRLLTQLSSMALAVLLAMLVSSAGADDRKLEGTWDVILQFPEDTCMKCGCPGGTPNIPLPTLNTFLKHGGMLWSGSSALAVGPGQGEWQDLGNSQYMARFKFFTFNPASGERTGSEELTKAIRLTGPDTFEATTTFDLFDAAGQLIVNECVIHETATRFE